MNLKIFFLSECHFHMLINILLDYYMLICNNNQHAAKISDLYIIEFKKEKSTCCMSLIFITHIDKQNQHNQLKIINVLKHKITQKQHIYIPEVMYAQS